MLYILSSANKENAKLSTTSIVTFGRIRKRSLNTINNNKLLVLSNNKKRAKTNIQNINNFELIASLIREQQEEQQQPRINNIQKALRLLDLEYKLRLSEDDFNSAVNVLGDSKKASSFISLTSNVQDRWIKRYTTV
jgi:hypothetical protein